MDIDTARYLALYRERFKPHTRAWLEKLLKYQYKVYLGKDLNLDDPQTFNEKLAWLKLNWTDERLPLCTDKAKAQAYAQTEAPEVQGHTVPQLAFWAHEDEFDFDSLPSAFALKLNCGSTKNILVSDKSKVNISSVKKILSQWLKPEENHYYALFEPSYKDIPSKIVVEELIDFEFKVDFFCFSGVPQFYKIVYNDKTPSACVSFFDMECNLLEVAQTHPNIPFQVGRPPHFKVMAHCAEKLSQGFPFVRIDFYCSVPTWYFCEMTFFHNGGVVPFTPEKYDAEFGRFLTLPSPRTV